MQTLSMRSSCIARVGVDVLRLPTGLAPRAGLRHRRLGEPTSALLVVRPMSLLDSEASDFRALPSRSRLYAC